MNKNRPSSNASALLKVENLGKRFGGIIALNKFDIEIFSKELVGLIGPNGAGKTTIFNLLSGVLKPTEGRVLFDGKDITRLRPDQNALLGIARTFQNIRLFGALSVKDNIKTAFHMRTGKNLLSTLFHTPAFRRSETEMTKKALEFIELLELEDYQEELAENLSYGIKRRVEIARALATLPKLLLLDEPAAGMNLIETTELIRVIRRIHNHYHLTIFLVEHDMKLVMELCERIQVINQGSMLAMGRPDEIRNDRIVIEAYLGRRRGDKDA